MTGREVHRIMDLPIGTSWDDLNPAQRAMYEEVARDYPELFVRIQKSEKRTKESRVISWSRAILEGLASVGNLFAGRDR